MGGLGVPEWIATFGAAIVGGLITAGASWGMLKGKVDTNTKNIDTLFSKVSGIRDSSVTRKEFFRSMSEIRGDLKHVQRTSSAVKEFLLSEKGAKREDFK